MFNLTTQKAHHALGKDLGASKFKGFPATNNTKSVITFSYTPTNACLSLQDKIEAGKTIYLTPCAVDGTPVVQIGFRGNTYTLPNDSSAVSAPGTDVNQPDSYTDRLLSTNPDATPLFYTISCPGSNLENLSGQYTESRITSGNKNKKHVVMIVVIVAVVVFLGLALVLLFRAKGSGGNSAAA